ncbi:MAG: BrnT family toxin [Armatimonadetes bacterium]|nr:BrnT family toxin [Armatimonadota bacterium]
MEFKWDDIKNSANIEKHGIDFADAGIVFEAPLVRKRDKRWEYGESRWLALGDLDGTVVVASYTHRKRGNQESIRIISMRKASSREREVYQKRTQKT